MRLLEDDLIAICEGVAAGYGFETQTCGGGTVGVCASDWKTVDRLYLSFIETGVTSREWDREVS